MLKLMALTFVAVTTSLVSLRSLSSAQPNEPDRTGRELCREVQIELDISVEQGLLTEEDAGAIVGRCYRYYVNKRG